MLQPIREVEAERAQECAENGEESPKVCQRYIARAARCHYSSTVCLCVKEGLECMGVAHQYALARHRTRLNCLHAISIKCNEEFSTILLYY